MIKVYFLNRRRKMKHTFGCPLFCFLKLGALCAFFRSDLELSLVLGLDVFL